MTLSYISHPVTFVIILCDKVCIGNVKGCIVIVMCTKPMKIYPAGTMSHAKSSLHWSVRYNQMTFEWHSGAGSEMSFTSRCQLSDFPASSN